jgi:hypothetical protein
MITGIGAIVNNEIVLVLKDRSSHSVLLKDDNTAMRLKSLIEEVSKEKKSVIGSKFENYITEIIVSEC